MNKNLKFILEKIFLVHFSGVDKNINIRSSSSSIVAARKLLPEYKIPRSEIIMPDGTVVKSLFLDYIPDQDYILSKIFRMSKKQFDQEVKKYECCPVIKNQDIEVENIIQDFFPDQEKKDVVINLKPYFPFFSYN